VLALFLLVAVDGKGQISMPAVIFYLMAQKHIIERLTSGAVKG
jgi:ABC-type maltose transport system permease subunit